MPVPVQNWAKLHVANLKKVPVHPQKMPVANYEGKFATGIKKCHGEKKKRWVFRGPGFTPAGPLAPDNLTDPAPGGAAAPDNLTGPAPGGALTPAKLSGPAPAGAAAPAELAGPGPPRLNILS